MVAPALGDADWPRAVSRRPEDCALGQTCTMRHQTGNEGTRYATARGKTSAAGEGSTQHLNIALPNTGSVPGEGLDRVFVNRAYFPARLAGSHCRASRSRGLPGLPGW